MPAQLIVIPSTPGEAAAAAPEIVETKAKPAAPVPEAAPEKKKGKKAKADDKVAKPPAPDTIFPLPQYNPFPMVSTIAVLGQLPNALGHFDTILSLVKSLGLDGAIAKLPGGSNTVFATVKEISSLDSEPLQRALAKLPEQLTIVVKGKFGG
jgi:hypothetical protein